MEIRAITLGISDEDLKRNNVCNETSLFFETAKNIIKQNDIKSKTFRVLSEAIELNSKESRIISRFKILSKIISSANARWYCVPFNISNVKGKESFIFNLLNEIKKAFINIIPTKE